MDGGGFVRLDEVMNYLKVKKGYKDLHIKDIEGVVQQNDKKRF